MKNTDDKILEKIYECITEHKIKCKNDLKLFGITDTALQKEILWEVFEEKILKTKNKNDKHKIIQIFHRGNLL
jgi:hypothetical protein